MITIREISTKKELKEFVKFPFRLFKDNPYWVPPVISEELNAFDPNINPVFEHASARYFLAYKNNEIVGRIAAIINQLEIKEQNIKKMRFGWYDVVDDNAVSEKLIEKIREIGLEHQLEFMEGPVGFSNLDKVGVVIEGFDQLGTSLTWYSQPYYKEHLEALGFKKEKVFIESYFYLKDVEISNYERFSNLIQKKYRLRPLNFKSTQEIFPFIDEMFGLFNKSYAKLSSFVPVTKKQIDFFKKKYLSFVKPEFIKFVLDENDKMVAFAITMPSYAKAMQKAKGKLFPFGFLHLLKARKNPTEVDFYLIGVLPEYQKKGVTSIIMSEYYKTYMEHGIVLARRTPELEDNHSIHLLWKNFNPIVHKKRATYVKRLT